MESINSNPKISVIIPVFNSEKYIKRCLDSVVNQTFKDLEILVIDDGSENSLSDFVQAYNDKRICYIRQDNRGLSATRNRGIDLAAGDYISFLDSDDWLDVDYYEKLYESIKKFDADIAVSGIIRLQKMHRKYFLKFDDEKCFNDTLKKFTVCDVPEKSYVWNKLYSSEFLKKSNIRFCEGRIYEDLLFTPQVLHKSDKLVTVPDTYYYYWRNNNSIVAQKSEKASQDYQYMDELRNEYLKQNNIDISDLMVHFKKYKIFGITIFKVKTKGNEKEYILFSLFKFKTCNKNK